MPPTLLIAPTFDGTGARATWDAFQSESRLAARHEVALLAYHERGRPTAASQLPGVRVVEWTQSPLASRTARLNSALKPGCLGFAVRPCHWIRRALAAGETFDMAHGPIPIAMRHPSPAAGLGIPLVLGPVGGTLADPPGPRDAGDTSPSYLRLRALDRWRLRHETALRRTGPAAECVLGIARHIADQLRDVRVRSFELLSETALQEPPPPTEHERDPHPMRMGVALVPTKGARDTTPALGCLTCAAGHLDGVDDRPDRQDCEALASELDLTDRVADHGRLPRATVDAFHRAADVFVFPSHREPGGSVKFAAMGLGLPLIVADLGGPARSVEESCAVRIREATPEVLAQDVAKETSSRTFRRVAAVGLRESKIDRAEQIYARAMATERSHFANGSPAAEHG